MRRPSSVLHHLGRLAPPALALALLSAAGCADDPLTPPPERAGQRLQPILATPTMTDADIDPNDTWMVAEATSTTTTTVDYGTPTYDPATGRTVTSVTLPSITETTRTEAGYGTNSIIRINTMYTGDTAGGVARVQLVGDSVVYYDAAGLPRTDLPGADLVATLGSFANDVVTDSIILAESAAMAPAVLAGTASLVAMPAAAPAVSPVGEDLTLTSDVSDAASGTRGQRTRVYHRQGAALVLAEERTELRTERDGIALATDQRTLYRNVAWHNAPERDAVRRARAAQARAVAGDSSGGVFDRAVAKAFGGTAGGPTSGSGAGASLLAALTPTADTTTVTKLNVGFVHGALSSASTWDRLDPWLSQNFVIGVKVKPSLDWRSGLENQARDLYGQLSATGATGFLLIGHSNGGLVARRAAQMGSGSPGSLVGGVVAISAPHQGVPLARVSRQVVGDFVTSQLQHVTTRIGGSCWRGQFNWLCNYATDAATELAPRVVTYALDDLAPFARDVAPGSTFLATLNATPENFRRYSIETTSQGRWKFVRLLGDWRCNPEDQCGGNHLQNAMESIYQILRYCGSNDIARARLGAISDKCRDVRWTLSGLDAQYERWTSPGEESDGLIPLGSQLYPGSLITHYTRRSTRDSHVSETRSSRVFDSVGSSTRSYSTK